MASICRLCLNEEAKLIDLFSDKESSERIQKIYEISNILMTPEAGCPNGVCLNCNRQLEISWKFRKQIQNAHIIITDTLKTSFGPSCGDEIVMAENLDKVKSVDSDKEIGLDIVAPDGEHNVFFEIKEIESEGKESLEMPIKEEICDAPISKSQPTDDIDKPTKLPGSSKQTNNRFHCKLCNREYRSKSGYVTHMALQTCVKLIHKCDKCDKRFAELDRLKVHQRTHTVKRFKCSHCGKLFLHEKNLNVHKRGHNIERKKFKCLKCPKQFNLVTERNEHLISHHNVCDIDKPTKLPGSSKQTSKRLQCKFCNREYRSKSGYVTHMALQTCVKRIHKCDKCDKRFAELDRLKIHQRTHTVKRIKCSYCGRLFLQESDLNVHKQTHNIKKMKFKCLKCPKQFNLVTERNEHLISHHNVSLAKCDQCDYVAVRMHLMKMHLRTHSGEKPFECAMCPKTFSHLSNFKSHVRTHTGDKRYPCNYCDLRFVHRAGMKRHANRHHPEEMMKKNDD